MNILLVYPARDDRKKSFLENLSSVFSKPETENINLLEISVYLPLTWEEKLIDLNVDKLNARDISWADYVVIYAEKPQLKSTLAMIHRFKSMNKKLVFCGNALQSNDSAYNLVDHFVANAAGFETFSNDVADNTLQKSYQPIFLKNNELPFQAYSVWGIVGKITRAIQPFPA